jgi:hypothetical protein
MQLSLTRITHNTHFIIKHLAACAYSLTRTYYSQYEFYEFTPCCMCIQRNTVVLLTIRNLWILHLAACAYSFTPAYNPQYAILVCIALLHMHTAFTPAYYPQYAITVYIALLHMHTAFTPAYYPQYAITVYISLLHMHTAFTQCFNVN